MSVFEIIMLACFGISWPVSVLKSIKTKSTAGKSFIFLLAILIGYIAGMIHKILYSRDPVFFLYLFNFLMVSFDLILYLKNLRREKSENELPGKLGNTTGQTSKQIK